MANAYNIMTRYFEMKGIKAPYSYHKFHEKIDYGVIDSLHEWPRKGDFFLLKIAREKQQPWPRHLLGIPK